MEVASYEACERSCIACVSNGFPDATRIAKDRAGAVLCGYCERLKWEAKRFPTLVKKPAALPKLVAQGTKKKQNGPKGATATFPDLKKTCPKGHILQELGLTLYGKCFECQRTNKKSGKKYREPIRYFYLPGLRGQMNGMTPEELADGTGVHRESIRKYTYKGSKTPERVAKVFAHVLGCSVDDLKWGGSDEDDDPCAEGARGEA